MENDFISRNEAWNGIYHCPTKTDADGYIWVRTIDVAHMIDEIPAADVRTATEISDAVDEAIDFLNGVSTLMSYHVYSALFDMICGICLNCGSGIGEAPNNG